MDNEIKREWISIHLPAFHPTFQEEFLDRLDRAIMRNFPHITSKCYISHQRGRIGVSIPLGLTDESRQCFEAVVSATRLQLLGEFNIGLVHFSSEQKSAPITGQALNSPSPATAPQFGERLLLLILRTKEERINIPGDLEEEYRAIAAKHGARYAKLWYYKQVAASTWPMVRKAVKWGIWAWVGEWIRRRI